MIDEIPRRCRLDLCTPAERAISDAMGAVEAMAADVRLTDAVILLGAARDSVADFVDDINKRRSVIAHPDALDGLRAAKYLNPVCAFDGCQWLRAAASDDGSARQPQEPSVPVQPAQDSEDDLHTGDDPRLDCLIDIHAFFEELAGDDPPTGDQLSDDLGSALETCDQLQALLAATIKRELAVPVQPDAVKEIKSLQTYADSAKVTGRDDRSTPVEIGVALIKGDGMPFAEVDLGDHVAAVTVYGGTQVEADQRAQRLADGWNAREAALEQAIGRLEQHASKRRGHSYGDPHRLVAGITWAVNELRHLQKERQP